MVRAAGLPIGNRESRPILVTRCRMAETQSSPESIEVVCSAATLAAPEGLSRLRSLTPRERAVLRMLTQGATRDEIASRLGVSRNTVRTHMQNLYAKLDLHSRVDILKFGAQHGLVSLDRSPRDPEAP